MAFLLAHLNSYLIFNRAQAQRLVAPADGIGVMLKKNNLPKIGGE
jgi:hypothetical protein